MSVLVCTRCREKIALSRDIGSDELFLPYSNILMHSELNSLLFNADTVSGKYSFVGLIRPVRDRPIHELSLLESIQDQYITRHLPDGRIVFACHR